MKKFWFRPALLVALAFPIVAIGPGYVHAAHATQRQAAATHLVHPGYLTVGSDTTYPPMESSSGPGKYVGADVDLANALAHAMGLKGAKIIDNTFDTIIPAMTTRHSFDVIMSSMNDTPERAKVIAFVDYMQSSEGIVVRANGAIHANTYAGMCGHVVAVESGTTEYAGLVQANSSCGKKIAIKNFTKDNDAFQAFASGHAEAYTGDLPVALLYVKQHHGSLRLAGRPFATGQKYGIGLAKNATGLHQSLVKALHKIRASGQYMKILRRWGVAAAAL